MTKKCKVVPKKYRDISGILLNKRIVEETIIESLNTKEVIRCMTNADVYEVIDGVTEPVLLHDRNYNKNNSVVTVPPVVPEVKKVEEKNVVDPEDKE